MPDLKEAQPSAAPNAMGAPVVAAINGVENATRQTMSVPEAGWHLGVGKNKSYDLAKEGVIPTIRLGKQLRVPVARFIRMLNDGAGTAA